MQNKSTAPTLAGEWRRGGAHALTITFVLSFVCLATPTWSDYKAGEDAYNRGDYATALRE